MPSEPVPADPGWDDDLAWLDQDPVTAEEREAWLDHLAESDDPPELEEDGEDFEPLTAEELAGIRELAASPSPLLPLVISEGRRGPGQVGSARVQPGESASRAAAFGPGMALDVQPACPGLAVAADAAAGDDDQYTGVSDEELIGVLCAWDRLEAHMAARKLAAIAELYRRRPGSGGAGFDEFAPRELGAALSESRGRAEVLLGLARELQTRLPRTGVALRDGTLS